MPADRAYVIVVEARVSSTILGQDMQGFDLNSTGRWPAVQNKKEARKNTGRCKPKFDKLTSTPELTCHVEKFQY
jgi:hypothetical protein